MSDATPDRHLKKQVCLRAKPEQIAAWKKTAAYVGEDLNTFLVNAAHARIRRERNVPG